MSAEQADAEASAEQLGEVLAAIVDDYLDDCGALEDVDSHELGQQLAAAVLERRMPAGVYYISNPERGWRH
jgi:hypothetical protein